MAFFPLHRSVRERPGVQDRHPELLPSQGETHVLPRNDVMYWPPIVAELLMPSISATAMVTPFVRTEPNIEGDGQWQYPGAGCRFYEGNLLYWNPSTWVFQSLPGPNTEQGVPQPVRQSTLAARFQTALEAMSGHLMGSP